jgi:histidinol-phosphate aminotransferase
MNIPQHIQTLPPYQPIEPFEVLSARLGRDPGEIIKLDANENPYGPGPAARRALAISLYRAACGVLDGGSRIG